MFAKKDVDFHIPKRGDDIDKILNECLNIFGHLSVYVQFIDKLLSVSYTRICDVRMYGNERASMWMLLALYLRTHTIDRQTTQDCMNYALQQYLDVCISRMEHN